MIYFCYRHFLLREMFSDNNFAGVSVYGCQRHRGCIVGNRDLGDRE